VTGAHPGHSTVAAIDGDGHVTVIRAQAPVVEGGLAVAPSTFGKFAGDLIAQMSFPERCTRSHPTEHRRWSRRRTTRTAGTSESRRLVFIPDLDLASATVYYADRATPGNPHPGTDNLLALDGADLARAGGAPGDLLIRTEGGAGLVAVRCDLISCRATSIILDNGTSHGEGHIVVAMGEPGAAFRPAPAVVRTAAGSIPVALVAGLVAAGLIVLLSVAFAVKARRRRLAA